MVPFEPIILNQRITTVEPYHVLALIYDELMSHVEYEKWARFMLKIFADHGVKSSLNSNPVHILECACGTGRVAELLTKYGYHVDAFDRAESMVKKAQERIGKMENINIYQADFLNFSHNKTYAAIICLYDSINYLVHEPDFLQFLSKVYKSLDDEGIFVFDVCTEFNSLQYFLRRSEKGRVNGYKYLREIRYNRRKRIQENRFTVNLTDTNEVFQEVHHQKIYHLPEIRKMLRDSNFKILEETDDFRRSKPNDQSLRVHFICEKKRAS